MFSLETANFLKIRTGPNIGIICAFCVDFFELFTKKNTQKDSFCTKTIGPFYIKTPKKGLFSIKYPKNGLFHEFKRKQNLKCLFLTFYLFVTWCLFLTKTQKQKVKKAHGV